MTTATKENIINKNVTTEKEKQTISARKQKRLNNKNCDNTTATTLARTVTMIMTTKIDTNNRT